MMILILFLLRWVQFHVLFPVRLWDTYSGNCLRTVQDHFRCGILSCTFHPKNNNFVVTGNERGFLQVLNVSTGKFLSDSLVKTNGRVLSMCFDAVSNVLWIGNDAATLYSFLFDVLSSKFILVKQVHLSSKNVAITSISAMVCHIFSLSCSMGQCSRTIDGFILRLIA